MEQQNKKWKRKNVGSWVDADAIEGESEPRGNLSGT